MKLEDKIKIISKAIEDKTGLDCRATKIGDQHLFHNGLYDFMTIREFLLEILPIQSPDSVSKESLHTAPDEWISVEERNLRRHRKYEVCIEVDNDINDRSAQHAHLSESGEWVFSSPMAQSFYKSGRAIVTHYKEVTPLPPAPNK